MKFCFLVFIVTLFLACSESENSQEGYEDTNPNDIFTPDTGFKDTEDILFADNAATDTQTDGIYSDITAADERITDTGITDNSGTDLSQDDTESDDTVIIPDTGSDINYDTGGDTAGEDTTDISLQTPYVKITSPVDGTTVKNPVTFTFVAQNVSTVRFFADSYPLGSAFDPTGKDSFTYTFSGVGYERNILLEGYNLSGETVASDSIRITVINDNDKGDLIGKMWNTYYYLVYENDYTGADDTTLYDSNCKAIADVPYRFSDAVCIEGSGKLADGRVINYAKTCSCGRKCASYSYIVCYSVLDVNKYPWGMGSKGNPLVPLRSWAVDNSIIPFGTVLYAEEWDGVLIPDVDGIGNFVHDGCFRADDIGGAIQGMHYDFFAGTPKMWKALEKIFPTKSNFNVYKNTPKCNYLKQ